MGSLTKWIVGAVTSIADPDREERIKRLTLTLQQHLSRALQSKSTFAIRDNAELQDCSERDLAEAKRRVYREALRRVWKDGEVTLKEKTTLEWAARALEIAAADRSAMNVEFAREHFAAILARAMEDGQLAPAEVAELQTVAAAVNSTVPLFARQFFNTEGEEFLRSIFLAYISDGRLSDREWKAFLNTATILGLSRDGLISAIRIHAKHFVEHVLAEAKADEKITDSEEATLNWLMLNLGLSREYVAYAQEEMRILKLLAEIAEGKLPSIPYPPGLSIRSGEIVHLHLPAIWHQVKVSRGQSNVSEHQGNLTLTDNRLLFSSPTTSHSISYRRIVAYHGNPRRLYVQVDGKPQCCYTLLEQFPGNYGIFSAAICKANQTLTMKQSQNSTRHIPREVRQRVWQKYGGRCAECGAEDYLEFDHIIPVARGGSNSELNIQLLCRQCNLKKSDAI